MRTEDLADEEINKKNKRLYDKLKNALGFKTECPECGNERFVKEVYKEDIIPLIKFELREGDRHPNDYLDISDLRVKECPECGVAVDRNFNQTEWSTVKKAAGYDAQVTTSNCDATLKW